MVVALTLAALLTAGAQSPTPTLAPPLTLQDAIAQARRDSPLRVGAASLAVGAADAARLAGRLPNPLFDLRSENWSPSSAVSLPLDIWALVTQPLELGGKRAARLGLAVADRDVAAAGLAVVDRRLVLQTVALYLQAVRARGVLATLTANRDGLTTLVDAMRRRVEAGTAAESDLLRFEAEAARIDIDIALRQSFTGYGR